jgi:hypothetical protein
MEELITINKILRSFEKRLYGINYECHFRFERLVESTDIEAAKKQIGLKFNVTYENKTLMEIGYDEFLDEIMEGLKYRGDKNSGVKLNVNEELVFEEDFNHFKNLLKQKFNPVKTTLYAHPEITVSIFWGFCFLIISKERNAIYLFEGVASD